MQFPVFSLYNRELGRDEFARDYPLQRRVSSELGSEPASPVAPNDTAEGKAKDAFEHDLHSYRVAQAVDRIPGQIRDVQTGGIAKVNPVLRLSPRDVAAHHWMSIAGTSKLHLAKDEEAADLDWSNGDFPPSGRSAPRRRQRGAARGLGGVDLVAQVDLFSAAPYEVSRT